MTPQPRVTIGLVGDYDQWVPAHQAIPGVLEHAAEALHLDVHFEWVPTDEITAVERVTKFDGLWCVPASPYQSMDGALRAIRYAREQRLPFLGTCGGFQHAIIEYARNVLAWADADHAETSPEAERAVITPLACALVETQDAIFLLPGTHLASAYGAHKITEAYRCRYGLNRAFEAELVAGPLRAAARDESGEIRAVELDGHPFFVATLFQPERAALRGMSSPIVTAFVRACAPQTAASSQLSPSTVRTY